MNKIFTLVISFIACGSLYSQITIQADDIAPTGVIAEQTSDFDPDASIQPGDPGMSSWNFEALEDEESGTFVFLEPQNTPYLDRFPSANLSAVLDNSTYFYLNKTDERIEILGIYGEFEYQGLLLEVGVDVVPPQSLIRFPAEFGNAYTEEVDQIITVEGSSIGAPFDSVRTVNHLKSEVNFDAFGEMVTPADTYETIRSSETEISSTDTYIYDNGWILVDSGDPDTIVHYNWWTNQNGLGFPVVQLDIESDGTREATWLTEFIVSTEEPLIRAFDLYPNPATQYLKLELREPLNGTFEILDIKGAMVHKGNIAGEVEEITLPQLTGGTYLLLLKDKNGKAKGFKKFEVQGQ